MSSQGFDTWILEVRGAGLSARQLDYEEAKRSLNTVSDWTESGNKYRTPVLSASGLPSTSAIDLFAAEASPSRENRTLLELIHNLSGFLTGGYLGTTLRVRSNALSLMSLFPEFQCCWRGKTLTSLAN